MIDILDISDAKNNFLTYGGRAGKKMESLLIKKIIL